MRLIPVLTAILVAVILYFVIIQRDALLVFGPSDGEETENAAAATTDGVEAASVEAGTAAKQDVDEIPVRVVVQRSVAETVEAGIVLRGRTEAARRVDVRAETSGLVISTPFPSGSELKAGEVLCQLDEGTRGAQLLEAKARLTEAETNNRAAASLAERGFTAETTAVARVAQLEAAKAAVEAAEKEVSRLTITAPFDGLLVSDAAEFGTFLQPGSACASIIDLDPIKFVGFVPERGVSQLSLGAMAGARLVSGQEARGFLTFVSRSADPDTRTFRVEVTVPNKDLAIRDGMTAEIFIALDGEKGHLLPQSVLTLNDAGSLGVRVAEGNIARFIPVSVIRDEAEGVWLGGLPEEVDVIVVGQEYVIDGRSIDVSVREDAS